MLRGKWTLIFLFLDLNQIFAEKQCPSQDTTSPCRCLVRKEEYQIWCTHSDLPRVLEGLRVMSQHIKDPIDELILENNYLPSLPGRTFSSLKVLRLMLRQNGLERVSSDWLAGLETDLMEIFIVEPHLRSLPDDSLLNLITLQAVTIETKLMKRLPLFSGLPKLRYVQIESESLLELSPTNFKKNPSLEKVHIRSSPRLTKLEANSFRGLPKLDLINITNCGLNWMHPRALVGLPVLKELSLVGNKITDAGMIGRGSRELPQLEIIRLDYNHVDKLEEASFVDLPSLKKIDLSNNRITELSRGAFHHVPSLKNLNLNRNFIKRIHPEYFLQDSTSSLEELLLEDNHISYVAELRSVLDALPRLIFLDMSFNNINAIPFGALLGHPTLEHLNLNYNKIELIDKEAFMAMPALRELRLKNNSLGDLLEPPFWNLPALKGLDLSENFFRKPDPHLLANLPSLRRVDLSGNGLVFVDPAFFMPTPALEHINVSYNELKVVHPATFRHLLHLYELDVSHNRLMEFVPGLPRGIEKLHVQYNDILEIPKLPSPDLDMPSLRLLDLRHNRIEYVPKRALTTLQQLKRLYLGNNLIHSLNQSSLEGLGKLETFDIGANRLAQIHPNVFTQLTELTVINLKKNRLDLLPPDIFRNSKHLKKLDISGNQVAEIYPETLETNPELQILDASNNVLVQLPKTLQGLKYLSKLDLTNNRMRDIAPDVLNSLENIEDLRLSRNFIQELKRGSFRDLQHLKSLQLDNNELNYVEPNALQNLTSLRTLKLSRNRIKEIPDNAFDNLRALQIIELQENGIRRLAPNAFHQVPHLLMLNLSQNQILTLEDASLRNLASLEVLDLSFNKISRLTTSDLEQMEWLVELRMDDNDVCTVRGSGFNNMPRLRLISLRNNKMMSFPEQAVQRLRGNIGVLDLEDNPLSCSCNNLWLQAWIQESSQQGPRCADGTLLRELRLSRDCPEEERNRDIVAPGCEAELLAYPGVQGQVFGKLTSSRNVSKHGVTNKVNLPPSPQESDYFYDEYVDYPYNESAVEGYVGGKYKDKEFVTEKVQLTTKLPTGDTPTLYALPKNKTKLIPQKVSDSPSSSGFTFFGVPLPNLNLNQLFGSGGRKMDDKTPPQVAERKTAIVSDPKRTTARVAMGNIQSEIAHRRRMKPQPERVANVQPPSVPELQGGFRPILPGSGGFKPIPNPALQVNENQTGNSVVLPKNPFTTQITDNDEVVRDDIAKESEQLPTHLNTPPTKLTNIGNGSEVTKRNASTQIVNIEQQTLIRKEISVLTNSSNDFVENKPFQIEEAAESSRELSTRDVTTTEGLGSTTVTPIVTTTPVGTTTTEMEESELSITDPPVYVTVRSQHNEPKIEQSVEILTGSPLSTLLAPNNQKPHQFKANARSTITKVASPLLEFDAPPDADVPDPMAHREGKTTQDFPSNIVMESSTAIPSDGKNWYFENYNKTNLEPFVAKIVNSSSAVCKRFQYLSLIILFSAILL